jgi:hypothetical protein
VRCLARGKYEASLLDVDLQTGTEIARTDGHPPFTDLRVHPSGSVLGIEGPPAVGTVPARLIFLSAEGVPVGEAEIPDATAGIAAPAGGWYIGCRQGDLFAFDLTGEKLWDWTTPGARSYKASTRPRIYRGSVYFRPCPYFVSSGPAFMALSSMGNVYAIDHQGRCLWDTHVGHHHEVDPALSGDGERLVRVSLPSFDLVSSLAVSGHEVGIGTLTGRLLVLDESGAPRAIHALGRRPVHLAQGDDSKLSAALCGGVVWFLDGHDLSGRARVGSWAHTISAQKDTVIAWGKQRVEVVSQTGRLIGSASLDRPISGVASIDDMLVVGAGGALFGIRVDG